jgi:hypothetical protein
MQRLERLFIFIIIQPQARGFSDADAKEVVDYH